MRAIDRDVALAEVTTLDEARGKTMAQPAFRAKALVLFGGLALLLASIGVYGLLSQSVAQRTRELGVRIAVGVLMALAASRAISALLYGIAPTDGATFATVIGTLAAVAVMASYLPARRAMRVNPIETLRSE